MSNVRTLRRSTEILNLCAISLFGALGVAIFVLGIVRSSGVIIVMGALYALATAWYLRHLVTRVASSLSLNSTTNELSWRALGRHGSFALESVVSVKQSPQPDIFEFVLVDAPAVHFWHRNRDHDAQEFFREVRTRRPEASFDPLYQSCKASWRRGLPSDDRNQPTVISH